MMFEMKSVTPSWQKPPGDLRESFSPRLKRTRNRLRFSRIFSALAVLAVCLLPTAAAEQSKSLLSNFGAAVIEKI